MRSIVFAPRHPFPAKCGPAQAPSLLTPRALAAKWPGLRPSRTTRGPFAMPIAIKMPALSPTMEAGTLAKWLVKVGDKVSSGDIMAEIETDKATMEFEAVDEGTISAIEVPEGTEGVKVGTVIAMLAGEDEDGAEAAPAAESKKPAAAAGATAADRGADWESKPDLVPASTPSASAPARPTAPAPANGAGKQRA